MTILEKKILENKIRKQEIKIAVIGLGYIGLPLALSFAKAGFKVEGIDKDKARVNKLKSYNSYLLDVSSKDIKKMLLKKRFSPTTDFRKLKDTEVIIICVPTPLKKKISPDISHLMETLKKVKKYAPSQFLLIIESTTFPGMTEEIIYPYLKRNTAKKEFYLVFSPERIDPANKIYNLTNIPKLIGGINQTSVKLAKLLYEKIVHRVYSVSSPKVAEMSKLLENTFRIVNIALINELAMASYRMGVDIWEVIEAAKTKPFGFTPFWPGPGVGGSCIPKDPLYLYWKAKSFGFEPQFIRLAHKINTSMPFYIVERLKEIILKVYQKPLSKVKILIVGVTYKKDTQDLRKSPVLEIINILKKKKTKLFYYDPYIPYLRIYGIRLYSKKLTPSLLSWVDCVVVATDHSCIDYSFILKRAKCIFDIRNVYKGLKVSKIFKL